MRVLSIVFCVALAIGQAAYADPSDNWNLRTNPTAWVVGPNLRLDCKVARQLAVGPALQLIDRKLGGVKINAYSVGLLAAYYFREAFESSWFLDFGMRFGKVRAEVLDGNGNLAQTQVSNLSARLLVGYHWFWGSFNLSAALGAESNSAGHADLLDQNGNRAGTLPFSPLGFATDASVGLSF